MTCKYNNCSELDTVYCNAQVTPNININAFAGVNVGNVLLIVPDNSLDDYKNHSVWGKFWVDSETDIVPIIHDKSRSYVAYNLNGRKISTPEKGINIIRYSDGTNRKVLIK